jgi:hypothetical protein
VFKELDDYDWAQVFGCCGEEEGDCSSPTSDSCTIYNHHLPEPVAGYTGSCTKVTREDVAVILAMSDGENDGANWLGAFQLKDGRYLYVEGWCDYTGWDCQSSGSSWVADTFDRLWHFGLTENARDRLGDALILHLAGVR